MKKLIFLSISLILLGGFAHSQMVVNDPMANAKLTQQTFIQNIMKGYQSLSTRIQNSTLSETITTSKNVSNQLSLFEQALDVSDAFQQLQSVKDFFNEHKRIIRMIQEVNMDMNSVAGVMRPTYRQIVRKNLEDAYVYAAKSMSVVSTSFIRRQINLADRLQFLKEAENYLGQAIEKLSDCIRIVGEAKHYHQNMERAKNFYKAIL